MLTSFCLQESEMCSEEESFETPYYRIAAVEKRGISWEEVYNDSKAFTRFLKTLPENILSVHLPEVIGDIILEFYDDFERCFDDDEYYDSHQMGYVEKCNLVVSFDIRIDLRRTNSFLCVHCKREKQLQADQDYDW
jgi:hypothetical protein